MTIITKSDIKTAAEQVAVETEPILAAILPGPPNRKVEAARVARMAAAMRERPALVRARARQLAYDRTQKARRAADIPLNVGAVRRREVKWGTRPPAPPEDAVDVGGGRWLSIQGLPLVAKHLGGRIAELVASSNLASVTVRKARPGEPADNENAWMQPGHARGKTWAEIVMREDNLRTMDHEACHLASFCVALEAAKGDIRRVVAARSTSSRRAFDERVAVRAERDPRSHVGYREIYAGGVAQELASAKAMHRRDREQRRRLAAATGR